MKTANGASKEEVQEALSWVRLAERTVKEMKEEMAFAERHAEWRRKEEEKREREEEVRSLEWVDGFAGDKRPEVAQASEVVVQDAARTA